MKYDRRLLSWLGVLLGTSIVLTGCTYNYDAVAGQLSVPEQREFHTYKKIMSAAQTRTYLAKTSAAERTAYLQEIGLAQRFQSLDPLDRDTVQNGFPRVGMSAEALRFVWGEPEYTRGDARRSAHWYYLGSSFDLGVNGNRYGNSGGNRVDVYLVDGKVMGWIDGPRTDDDKGSDRCDRC
jgi:hypothetical protein